MPQLEEKEALVLDAHHHPKSRSHGSGNRRVAPASGGGSPEPAATFAAVEKPLGSYHWRDGDHFVGEWSSGEISGFWDKCSAVFTAAAGAERRRSVDGAAGRGICIWESDGESGDITCEIIGTVEASSKKLRRDFKSFNEAALRPTPCCLKKPGEMISKGHKKYDLMLNLQLGISYSVGKPALTQMRNLAPRDFDPREKFWTRFPPEGSRFTPSHASIEFRWKDYCPMVFRHLRKLFSVDSADYMLAICGNDSLRELSSPGKSGSFFYLTQDDRFMIKTVKKSEVKVLIRMLPNYYPHMCQYNNSLVTKFFGVHCIKPVGGPKVRFIVIGNLFCSEYQIHRRFDLKGSSYGRITDKPEGEINETTTFKDLDLNFVFRLQKSWFEELIKQIDRDCKFLEGERIMDYSLLLGVHFCDDVSASKIGLSPCVASPNVYGKWDSLQDGGWMSECRLSEVGWHDADQILDVRNSVIQLGSKMPSRAEHIGTGEVYDAVLYFGVIDVLQDYDISKKLEHAYKSLQVDPTSISAVDPKLYSRRFRDFIYEIFTEDR